jgi:Ca-activated chloride channel family protein
MIFSDPFAGFPAVVVAIGIVLLIARASRIKAAGTIVYSNLEFLVEAAKPNPWLERGFTAAFGVGLSLLVASCAHPYHVVALPVPNTEIAICIDTSGSMASTDIPPARAQAAIAAVRAFISDLPHDVRVELIAFSTTAEIVQPFITNRDAFESALGDLPQPNGATAIGDAFALARQSFTANHPFVLLLTDGVNNRGRDPLREANALAVHGIRIDTVGIGKTNGDILPGTSERAGIDEAALRTYARIGRGTYYSAASANDMRKILAELSRKIAYVRRPFDLSYLFALVGGTLAIVGTVAAFVCGRIP